VPATLRIPIDQQRTIAASEMDGERWAVYCAYCHRNGYDHDDARQWQAFRNGYIDGCLATAFPLKDESRKWDRRMHGKLRHIEHLMLAHFGYLKIERLVTYGLLIAASFLVGLDWWFAPWLWLIISLPGVIILGVLRR
jgi:hypothetical protein